jgi:CxxC motif-containing protein
MKVIQSVRAKAPVRVGDVILPDLCGTGIPLIATKDIRK